jgi:CheY-like chemotaxis protein
MDVKKILLVDDDREDQSIINDALHLLVPDDMLWLAENGEHALEVLETHYKNQQLPCLIVLDLNMPKMNGTQTLVKLKADERFRNIPVIIYSTSINPLEKEKCLQIGAHSYITKPVSYNEGLETAKVFLQFCQTISDLRF